MASLDEEAEYPSDRLGSSMGVWQGNVIEKSSVEYSMLVKIVLPML